MNSFWELWLELINRPRGNPVIPRTPSHQWWYPSVPLMLAVPEAVGDRQRSAEEKTVSVVRRVAARKAMAENK